MSVWVQAFPSAHAVPSCLAGLEQMPLAGVADARIVALIGDAAGDGVRANAGTVLAGVGLGARVAVAAHGAVRFQGVAADARARIAGAGEVTVVRCAADDGIAADADAALAGVGLGAGVAVVAGRAVGLGLRLAVVGALVADGRRCTGRPRRRSSVALLRTCRPCTCRSPCRRARRRRTCHWSWGDSSSGRWSDCRCRRRGTGRKRCRRRGSCPCRCRSDRCRSGARVAIVAGAPFGLAGLEHVPVCGSQRPASWHWSEALHTTGLAPVQAPARQVSVWVQALPSSQVLPFAFSGLEQVPVAGLHVPASWHWSSAVQVTGFAPVQTPAWQVSARGAGIAVVAGRPVRQVCCAGSLRPGRSCPPCRRSRRRR